ncbi:MAG TPA: phosphatidate cytidylyltransferase [Actinomycetota bacterium]|jgi:phosphatidate cytidylyltransferase|nr:phosphatidate cytidylyltransferase [Actinomycetota bacterium]
MPDEKNGDELFEDLDKFFAPIRDVDWEEPEEPAAVTPSEEHVSVRTEDPVAEVSMPQASAPEPPPPAIEDDDEAWHDTGQLEQIDEILGEPEQPDVVTLGEVEEPPGDAAAAEPAEMRSVWEEPPSAGFEQEAVVVRAPSEEELQAAAEHFAGSIGHDETYPTEPVDVFGGESRDSDLLSDLGAEEIEEELLSDIDESSAPRTVVVGGEGTSGPSWQEPAAVEVGAEIDRRGPSGDRDVPAAFMTGVGLAAVAVVSLWAGPAYFAAFAGLLVLVAQGELFGVLVKHHARPASLIGLVAGGLMMLGAYWRGEAATPAMFALGVVAAFLWFMTVPIDQRVHVVRDLGMTVLNMAWIPLLGGYLIATLKLPDGNTLVLSVILLTFLFDTTAFLAGSISGGGWIQRPLAPNVSPKKSWEGIIIGAAFTTLASAALVTSFVSVFEGRRLAAVALGLVISIAATFGDLAESLIKRDIGVKDMGTLLPGHGGVLDRIDSLLFVAPATFLLFRIVFG